MQNLKVATKRKAITLPNEWTPRHYQIPPLAAFDGGIKRAFLVWHRRAGKDSFGMNYAAKETHARIGTYYHMLPSQRQARRVIWNGIGKNGVRLIDQAFPKELRKRTLEDEMMIEFNCGSIWQLCGSDNYDSLVGTNVAGIVLSEWSISNPNSWDYMRPILVENGGWSIFIGTPRGKNFFHKQYENVKTQPDWFTSLLTVEDTGVISLDQIDGERRAGMSEDKIRQEFYCDFSARTAGVIYDSEISEMEKAGRLGSVLYDPRFPVETCWDFGHRDAAAIIFAQRIDNEVRIIDYHEYSGGKLLDGIKVVREKPYTYSRHIAPHDLNKFEFGGGTTPDEVARANGFFFVRAPKLGIETGIDAVRFMLPRTRIDGVACEKLVRAARHYHYETDDDKADTNDISLASKPKHDWSSHGCDALRYLAVTPETFGLQGGWVADMAKRMQEGQKDWTRNLDKKSQELWDQQMAGVDAFDPLVGWR